MKIPKRYPSKPRGGATLPPLEPQDKVSYYYGQIDQLSGKANII
jgi:hypothetical protein